MVMEKGAEDYWTNHVRNEGILHRVKGKRNLLQTIKKNRKYNWIGDIMLMNCLLKACYGRKDRRKGRSDGKMRTKTYAAMG